jgi:hypothetical protein
MTNSKNILNLRIETKYLDEKGEILVTEYSEETSENADESINTVKRAQNIILSSGEAFNPSMSAGPKPVLAVGLCDECRNGRPFWPWKHRPKVSGLCNVQHLKPCEDCGKPQCPKHRKCSTYDKKHRCLRCHRKHKRGLFLGRIFYEEVDS